MNEKPQAAGLENSKRLAEKPQAAGHLMCWKNRKQNPKGLAEIPQAAGLKNPKPQGIHKEAHKREDAHAHEALPGGALHDASRLRIRNALGQIYPWPVFRAGARCADGVACPSRQAC